jgi:hypothetical protein
MPAFGARCFFAWVILLGLCAVPAVPQHYENEIRAAFVYNLTKYVEWPHPKKELVIGFVGDSSMGETLQKIVAGKVSGSRGIRVVLSPSEAQLEQCDILYVAYSSPKKTRAVFERIRGKDILSVVEEDSSVRDGGMVGLVRSGDHIQIEVNLDAVQSGNLKISSRLLALASIVHSGRKS